MRGAGLLQDRLDSGGERLEAKLENDYLCWYNVSIGPSSLYPDSVVFHPGRGLFIVKPASV
jgi:hypothetical protein